jgi:uncharacterized protein
MLNVDLTALSEICRRHHIRRLSLFGSTLHGTARPDSDLDLLVEFEQGKAPGLLGLAAIELELAGLFENRKVDLRTADDLSRYFRAKVTAEAEELFTSRDIRHDEGNPRPSYRSPQASEHPPSQHYPRA